MWGQFVFAFLLSAGMLLVPGFVLAKGARCRSFLALGIAPALSVAGYAVLCLVYKKLGVPTSFSTVTGGLLIVTIAAAAVMVAFRRLRGNATVGQRFSVQVFGRPLPAAVVLPLCYVTVALLACTVLFLKPLDGADAFVQAFDNVSHLGTIRGAIDSGILDPLGAVGYYTAVDEMSKPLVASSSFYPEMWHMVVAMVASVTGGSIPLAINAVNCSFAFVALPLGVCALLFQVFGPDVRKLLLGALSVIVFEAFPWGLLVFGPVYPNLASFSLVPGIATIFLQLTAEERLGAMQRVAAAIFFCAGALACVVMQPNAIFTVGVLVAPYCVWRASRLPLRIAWAQGHLMLWRVAFGVVALFLIVGAWRFMYDFPALYSVVHNNWPSISSVKRALFDVVLLGLMKHPVQPVVAVLVWAGVARTLVMRKYRWLSAAYLVCCIMYFCSAATDGFWDTFLTGFWYSDQYRIAAMVALAGMPLFVLGLEWALSWAGKLCARFARDDSMVRRVVPGAVTVVLVAAIFWPPVTTARFHLSSAFGAFTERAAYLYNAHSFRHLSYGELQFACEAQQIVGNEGLIANEPFDGSVYMFGPADMPLYYKSLRGFGDESEKETSVLIREHLHEIASNPEVQQAARDANVRYVLQLDKDNAEKQPGRHGGYKEAQWVGIASVDDDTPGFTTVLSKDDMRLYKIDDAYLSDAKKDGE